MTPEAFKSDLETPVSVLVLAQGSITKVSLTTLLSGQFQFSFCTVACSLSNIEDGSVESK